AGVGVAAGVERQRAAVGEYVDVAVADLAVEGVREQAPRHRDGRLDGSDVDVERGVVGRQVPPRLGDVQLLGGAEGGRVGVLVVSRHAGRRVAVEVEVDGRRGGGPAVELR